MFSISPSLCAGYYSITKRYQSFLKHTNTAVHRSVDGRTDRSINTPRQKPKKEVMSSRCAQKQAGLLLEDLKSLYVFTALERISVRALNRL